MGNTNDLQKSFGGILVITCNTTICNLQTFGQTGYGATRYDHYVVIFMPLKYIKLKLQLQIVCVYIYTRPESLGVTTYMTT